MKVADPSPPNQTGGRPHRRGAHRGGDGVGERVTTSGRGRLRLAPPCAQRLLYDCPMTANKLIAALSALSAAQLQMPVISYDRLESLGDVVGIEQVTLEMEFDGAEERTRPALSFRVEEFTEPERIAFTTKPPR